MPKRPPTVCSYAGCVNVTTDPARRCHLHPKAKHNWKPDRYRGSRHQRGYGYAWEKLRKQILERDHYLCQPCLQQGRTTAGSQVDHIIPKAKGGTDHTDNLQTICIDCHKQKTARE